MLALATSGEGAIPVFLRPLDGNASDQRELAQTMEALVRHLQEAGEEPGLYVADGGVYSAANMRRFAEAGVRWVSRGAANSPQATALLGDGPPRRARFLVATNILDPAELPAEQVISTYKAQSGVERGFAFLKDPLFLASSVFLKRPERIMALACIMVLCLLVYRLAEWRLRQHLAASDQTVPNQLKQPTNRPPMRWMFECFEGISLPTLPSPGGSPTPVHGLQPLHQLVLRLLGPAVSKMYESSN